MTCVTGRPERRRDLMKCFVKKTWPVVSFLALGCIVLSACYGKDTGPQAPREKEAFMPTLEEFTKRSAECLPEMVEAVVGRAMTAEEQTNDALKEGAVGNLRTELLQCFTGRGYGNEVQIESSYVRGWLAKPDCVSFAKAFSETFRCSVLQMTLEDSGFDPGDHAAEEDDGGEDTATEVSEDEETEEAEEVEEVED